MIMKKPLFVLTDGSYIVNSNITHPKTKITEFMSSRKFSEETEVVLFYNETDRTQHQIPLRKFINDDLWQTFKKKPNWKLVISYVTDYYNYYDIDHWISMFEKHNMQNQMHKVFIGCLDINFESLLHRAFKKREFPLPTTYMQPVWVNYCHKIGLDSNPTPTKKFSIFSRNFKAERLDLFYRLHERGILDPSTCNFTFWNCNPYIGGTSPLKYSVSEMQGMYAKWLESNDVDYKSYHKHEKIQQFLNAVPYTLNEYAFDSERLTDKWNDLIITATQDACFHVVIESHFKHYAIEFINLETATSYHAPFAPTLAHPEKSRFKLTYNDFSATFVTEKTYKALISKRPFIGYASAYYLKYIKNMGFKTFSPWIDESYDTEENDEQRLQLIIKEIAKLNSMSLPDLHNMLSEMEEILAHNRDHVSVLASKHTLPEEISWMDDRNICMTPHFREI